MIPCAMNRIDGSSCIFTVENSNNFCVACTQFLKDAFARTLKAENCIEFHKVTDIITALIVDAKLPW